jgi:hypothetical protein
MLNQVKVIFYTYLQYLPLFYNADQTYIVRILKQHNIITVICFNIITKWAFH